jgi:hypothetical protein
LIGFFQNGFGRRASTDSNEPVWTAAGELEVLECNWPAVETYLACQWHVGVGMEAVVWFGIAAVEIRAQMEILRIQRREWADTQRRVLIMVNELKPLRNKKRR